MIKPIHNFVIIDDDSCHNIVCALSLKKAFKPFNINITGFTNVAEGIDHLVKNVDQKSGKTVLFLDIYMPGISGWDVLTTIEAMPKTIKNNLIVYMLSSSISKKDKERAFLFSCVKDCIQKPLSEQLIRITEELTEMTLMKQMYA